MAVITGDNGPNNLNDTSSDDQISAFGGDDTITVTDGDDTVDGGEGHDTLVINWGAATAAVVQTNGFTYTDNGSRSLFHTVERMVITTGSGNDNFQTNDFNDIVSLGAGNDYVNTFGGDDQVDGGSGDDRIEVGSGNDTANGGAGNDRISADLSAATGAIVWNLQTNSYSGPIGSFTNFEYFGHDFQQLKTGSGNDVLITGTGNFNDALALGAGDDSVTVVNGHDTVGGDEGLDTLVIDWGAATAAVVQPTGFTYTDNGSRSVTHSGIERLVINTGSGNDNFQTNDFNDIVNLGAGNDTVATFGGNDSLNGGTGADAMTGGLGNDVYFVDNVGDQLFEAAGEGQDSAFSSVNYELAADQHVEILATISPTATTAIRLTGNELANTLIGNAGINRLDGNGGNDLLIGGRGADRLIGDGGIDTVDYTGNFGAVSVNLTTNLGQFNFAHGDIYSEVENANGTEFNDILTGSAVANVLNGNGGNDQIRGEAGNDKLIGGNGADQLIGGAGNDNLIGGIGADVLDGGANVDTVNYSGNFGAVWVDLFTGVGKMNFAEGDTYLGIEKAIGTDFNDIFESNGVTNVFTGGLGNDRFVFRPGFSQDIITDFDGNGAAAGDTIRFRTGIFTDFADMMASASQQGSDVLIQADAANSLLLKNVLLGDLHSSDFIFG